MVIFENVSTQYYYSAVYYYLLSEISKKHRYYLTHYYSVNESMYYVFMDWSNNHDSAPLESYQKKIGLQFWVFTEEGLLQQFFWQLWRFLSCVQVVSLLYILRKTWVLFFLLKLNFIFLKAGCCVRNCWLIHSELEIEKPRNKCQMQVMSFSERLKSLG